MPLTIFYYLTEILMSTAHGSSNVDHITNMIVSSLIHGLIYGVIFKTIHSLPLPAAIVVVVLGVGGIWLYYQKKQR